MTATNNIPALTELLALIASKPLTEQQQLILEANLRNVIATLKIAQKS